MNDFNTISSKNHNGENTGRNIAIGATTAAFVALLGIGSAVVLGSSNSNAASADADAAPAIVTPAIDAPAAITPPVTVEVEASDAPVEFNPVVTLEAAPIELDPALAEITMAPAPEAPAPIAAPAPAKQGPCPTYNATNNLPLQLCDKGDWVSEVQRLLVPFADVSTDGFFGPQTEDAVKFMQGEWGFEQNGLVTEELIDVISKIDPSCDADGSMCDGPGGYDEDMVGVDLSLDVNGDGWVSDYERDFPFDAYCDHVLAVTSSSAGQIEFTVEDVDNCLTWFSHFDD